MCNKKLNYSTCEMTTVDSQLINYKIDSMLCATPLHKGFTVHIVVIFVCAMCMLAMCFFFPLRVRCCIHAVDLILFLFHFGYFEVFEVVDIVIIVIIVCVFVCICQPLA